MERRLIAILAYVDVMFPLYRDVWRYLSAVLVAIRSRVKGLIRVINTPPRSSLLGFTAILSRVNNC